MAKDREKRKGRGSGFVYKKRSSDGLKARAEQSGWDFDSFVKGGVPTYKPKVGSNSIRLVPPTWEDADHYGYDVWLHRNVGPDNGAYLCLQKMKGKFCPVCAAVQELKSDGDDEDAKQLTAKKVIMVYLIDRDDSDTLKTWPMSWTNDKAIAELSIDNKTGKALNVDDPEHGYDISFRREGTGLKTKYLGIAIDRKSSPIMDDDDDAAKIMEEVEAAPLPSILKFYPADYLEDLLQGKSKKKKNDDDEDDEDRPKKKRRRDDDDDEDDRPSRRRRSDDDDDEDEKPKRRRRDDDDDDDDEDEKPKRRRRDDDDDDEDEKPTKKKRRSDDDDDDEDEKPKRRRRDDDDDEDEKPKRRRRDDDDDDEDEDEKPAKKKRRDDDDEDEDDRPRRRR